MYDDAMVPIARILGRGEALTVAAMLDAAGIIVHVGGEYYASVSPEIVAIGGFRLTVPAWQYDDASDLLREVMANPEAGPGGYMRRAIGRFAAATVGATAIVTMPYAATFGFQAFLTVFFTPLMMLQLPRESRCTR